MKKLLALLTVLLLTVVLMAACGCDHEWEEANCIDPKTCTKCGATEGEDLGHDYQDADCENPKTCSRCGKTKGDALGHTWQDADCENPAICTVCGGTDGEALGHDYSAATCEEDSVCSRCGNVGAQALGHSWVDATCETPKTCSACAAMEGEALGHSWTDATCETPKTCTVCAAAEGEALGHSWYEATYVMPQTCITCGATEGEPLQVEKSALGLGYSIDYFNEYVFLYMNANGYYYTLNYVATEDGAQVYQAYDQNDNAVAVYVCYYMCEDGVTVDGVMIYTDNGMDSALVDLTGAYLGSTALVVDPDNAAAALTQLNTTGTTSEDGTTISYYTEYNSIAYWMFVAATAEGNIQVLCLIGPLE